MASNAQKKPPVKKRRANGYKMPDRIPKGEVMTDISNNKWVINSSIGIGGFGEIYSAAKESNKSQNNYVIKVEPSENGPLFCEKTVYLKIGKIEDIKDFMRLHKLKSLGMPTFYGCGTHMCNNTKFRFLVMERYGKDLWSIFIENGRIFPPPTVFRIGIQVLDVLEYIHGKSYVHADIKGANLLLGLSKGFENQVYLVDFGLAARYPSEFKPNPKKAHNGTLEYTSRDAHVGVTTRRGDIEILGYNMIQWLSSSLPWEKLTNPSEVESQKNERMKDCNKFVKNWVKDSGAADIMSKFLERTCKLGALEDPNYDLLRRDLHSGASTNKLSFSPPKSPRKSPKAVTGKSVKVVNTNKDVRAADPDEPVSKRTRGNRPKVCYVEDDEAEEDEDEDDGDMFKLTPPKEKSKRSWKDAPTIVSCTEVYSSKKY
ncbi:UNVERIFIED_CONTAM: hypothetical protein PYX00_006983 [Menopon gallinae]|uniref:non-specific serine/threonine protein kinase n=1 Tax=Menopon gallinae TaxID=328185 RepID=A0AAW2HHX8_9NEOP